MRYNTIREIEKIDDIKIQNETNLVKRINKILDKPLTKFEIEDVRLLTSQNMFLDHSIPLAIELLEKKYSFRR